MRSLLLLFAGTSLAIGSVAALLSVIPLLADAGGADSAWVGATTGVMMAATVLTQFGMVWLLRVLSLRRMYALGAAILALATPAYVLSDAIGPILAVSAVRGVGFALVVVAGAALVPRLAPVGKVATATGIYGAAAGVPNVVLLPGGLWLAQNWGFTPVFWLSAALAAVAVVLVLALPETGAQVRRPGRPDRIGWNVWLPALVFLVTSATLGTIMTFLPVALTDGGLPSLLLLVLSVAMVLSRMLAGVLGDRRGHGRLLGPAVVLCALGAGGLALGIDQGGPLLLAGAVIFGAGFGAAQNESFLLILRRLGPGRSGAASTVWNIGYDGGMGLGPFVVGAGLVVTGYSGGFAALAGVLLIAAVVGYVTIREASSSQDLR